MTHADLIFELGGGAVLSDRLKAMGHKVDREAIYKWRETGVIPWKWRTVIAAFAKRDRIPLPKNFLLEVKT